MKLTEVAVIFEPCDELDLEPDRLQKIRLGNVQMNLTGGDDEIEKEYLTDEAYLEIRLDDRDAKEKWAIERLDARDVTSLSLEIDGEWQLIRVPWDARSDYVNYKQQGYYDADDKLYKLLITENDAYYQQFARLHGD